MMKFHSRGYTLKSSSACCLHLCVIPFLSEEAFGTGNAHNSVFHSWILSVMLISFHKWKMCFLVQITTFLLLCHCGFSYHGCRIYVILPSSASNAFREFFFSLVLCSQNADSSRFLAPFVETERDILTYFPPGVTEVASWVKGSWWNFGWIIHHTERGTTRYKWQIHILPQRWLCYPGFFRKWSNRRYWSPQRWI